MMTIELWEELRILGKDGRRGPEEEGADVQEIYIKKSGQGGVRRNLVFIFAFPCLHRDRSIGSSRFQQLFSVTGTDRGTRDMCKPSSRYTVYGARKTGASGQCHRPTAH